MTPEKSKCEHDEGDVWLKEGAETAINTKHNYPTCPFCVPAEEKGQWWCPNCQDSPSAEHVTFEENHTTCGHPVEWVVFKTRKPAEKPSETPQDYANRRHDNIHQTPQDTKDSMEGIAEIIVKDILPFEPNELRWDVKFLNARINLRRLIISALQLERQRGFEMAKRMAKDICMNNCKELKNGEVIEYRPIELAQAIEKITEGEA